MPGNYTLRETYVDGDVLSAADYVADHQQHIDNQTPIGTDDYSSNVTQMRTITSPGDVGSESLPTSLAGEIERLRFTIKQIKDLMNGSAVAQWYTTSFNLTLADSTVTAAKLADGATFIQVVTAVGLLDVWSGTFTTQLTQAFTSARTHIRISVNIEGYVQMLQTNVAGVVQWRLQRDGTTVYTSPSQTYRIPAGEPFTDDFQGYQSSAVIVQTVTAGAHTWTIQGLCSNTVIEVAVIPRMVLEEIA